ncbi:MAG: TolC family protein [Bacteroidales bacterium]|nr:TolC family protein [Bacteroidales bacterium]
MRKIAIIFFALAMMAGARAQSIFLSLDSCLALAVRNNKDLTIAQMKEDVATLNRKEAFTHYLPRVDATGAYVRTEKQLSLLSDEQKDALSNMGTTMGEKAGPIIQNMAAQNPQFASLFQQLGGLASQLVPEINQLGQGLVDALHTDTRNTTAAAIMLTQPLYMGGKIVAYNNITRYAEQIAKAQSDQKMQDLVVQVETAYWQIVSLESKRELALGYKKLIDTLDYNVEQLIEGGLATKADGLSVKVKKNEADVTLIQIDNGLALSRMLLCQLCGIDVNTEVHPTDDVMTMPQGSAALPAADCVGTAMESRPELRALSLLTKVNNEKVKVVRSDFLPKVALNAGYLWSNPSVYNSFERKFKGMWSVGVMVNVPLINWGEGCYKVRAAKTEARISELTLEDVREKIELQTTQCSQKLLEATNREETAQRSMAEAEENLRFANLGLSEGVIPVSNVLAAQTAWLSARSTVIAARIDRCLAELNLKRAMGVI